jgi:hypothetical protein
LLLRQLLKVIELVSDRSLIQKDPLSAPLEASPAALAMDVDAIRAYIDEARHDLVDGCSQGLINGRIFFHSLVNAKLGERGTNFGKDRVDLPMKLVDRFWNVQKER